MTNTKDAIIQEHKTLDGKVLKIAMYDNNGSHKYSLKEPHQEKFGELSPSVTSLIKRIDDSFSAGRACTIYEAKRTGVPEQASLTSEEAIKSGIAFHQRVEDYINYGTIDPDDDMFMAFYKEIGKDTNWVASEVFCYDRTFNYGGTIDAISFDGVQYTVWDFKTKNDKTYRRNWYYPKDRAQLSAYARALMNMQSSYYPVMEAKIVYVMRDSPLVEVQSFNLGDYISLFERTWKFNNHIQSLAKNKTKVFRLGE